MTDPTFREFNPDDPKWKGILRHATREEMEPGITESAKNLAESIESLVLAELISKAGGDS